MADPTATIFATAHLERVELIPSQFRLGKHDYPVDLNLSVFDCDIASPFEIALAASASYPLALALEVAATTKQEKGAGLDTAVYVIAAENHNVAKIGIATNPRARLESIQTSNWDKLRIEALFWVYCGARVVEQATLAKAGEAGLRRNGEWVACSPEQAALMVAETIHRERTFAADSGMWLRNRMKTKEARAKRYKDAPDYSLGYANSQLGDRLAAIRTKH